MKIDINAHSSIRIKSDKVIYFDPFKVEKAVNDADIVFITHSHYDHLSPEDILKVSKKDTSFVLPDSCRNDAAEAGLDMERCIFVKPGEISWLKEINFRAVPAFNIGKKFHPMMNGWLGYVASIEGRDVYVCGDTDDNPYVRSIRCDICLVPVGGKYTMSYEEAADMINETRPAVAIPTHYGSIVGNVSDGEDFRKLIDDGIEVRLILQGEKYE